MSQTFGDILKGFNERLGVRPVGDPEGGGGSGLTEYEMDPEKVGEVLGVKVVKVRFNSLELKECSMPTDSNVCLPTLYFTGLIVEVEDSSLAEKDLVPRLTLDFAPKIQLFFQSLELRAVPSGRVIKFRFLAATTVDAASSSDPLKSLPEMYFLGLTFSPGEGAAECPINFSEATFSRNDSKAFSLKVFPGNSSDNSSISGSPQAFASFVMNALGICVPDIVCTASSTRMLNVLIPLFLDNERLVPLTFTASEVCVNRGERSVVLSSPCLSNNCFKAKKVTLKKTREEDGDSDDCIECTIDGAPTVRYDAARELLLNVFGVHLRTIGKRVRFTFRMPGTAKCECVVVLADGAYAKVSKLLVEAAVGAKERPCDVVKINFERAYVRKKVNDNHTELIAIAERDFANKANPCITLTVESESAGDNWASNNGCCGVSDDFDFCTNADRFKAAREGCRVKADIRLLSLSAQTISALSAAIMLGDPAQGSVFITLNVVQNLLLHIDASRCIASTKPATLLIHSTGGEGKPAYHASFDDLNVYVNNDSAPVAFFHRLPIVSTAARSGYGRPPVVVYGDRDALFVAAEWCALLMCPETLGEALSGSPLFAGKSRVEMSLDRSSIKLCNRTTTMKTLISVAVAAAENVRITITKPSDASQRDCLNVRAQAELMVANAELYTVGLLNKMGLPRVAVAPHCAAAPEAQMCENAAEYWTSLGFLRVGRVGELDASAVLAFPGHCSLGVSVNRVHRLEMDVHPDTYFPLLDIFRCCLAHVKVLVEEWKKGRPLEPELVLSVPPARLKSKMFMPRASSPTGRSARPNTSFAPSSARSTQVTFGGNISSYNKYAPSLAYSVQGTQLASKESPKKSADFTSYVDFKPEADYHDPGCCGGIKLDKGENEGGNNNSNSNINSSSDDNSDSAFFNDLLYTEVAFRVCEIDELTIHFKSEDAVQRWDSSSAMPMKASESKIMSYTDTNTITNTAEVYYRTCTLPKEAYWLANIVFAPAAKAPSPYMNMAGSSIQGKQQQPEEREGSQQQQHRPQGCGGHTLSVTVRRLCYHYSTISSVCMESVPAKKRVFMWFDSFTAKYDGELIGEDRKDHFRCSYIPGPPSPYVAFFMSFVVPKDVNDSAKNTGNESNSNSNNDGYLSIYINPCYVSFMQNVFAMFDKYAKQRDSSLVSKTPLSKDIYRITLHPFVLNFDWVALNGYVSFKNVVTETQLLSFEPDSRSWGSVLPEIVRYMRSKYLVALLSSSFYTGAENPMCSVARIFRSAKEVVVRPVQGANQGARNAFMGVVEGTWDLTCTLFEETKSMGSVACQKFITLYQKSVDYYYGNSNNGGSDSGSSSSNSSNDDSDENSGGPATNLFMALPFGYSELPKK